MEHKGVDTKPTAKQLTKRSKRKTSVDTKVTPLTRYLGLVLNSGQYPATCCAYLQVQVQLQSSFSQY